MSLVLLLSIGTTVSATSVNDPVSTANKVERDKEIENFFYELSSTRAKLIATEQQIYDMKKNDNMEFENSLEFNALLENYEYKKILVVMGLPGDGKIKY